nr:integrase, catalytic region, zinc finger, CCHC-type, peptidase aspartic, catalytic [Tanacetum cinerariifolium]
MNKKPCLKNTNVLAPRMYKIHTDHTQARTSKFPQVSKTTKKRVSFSTGVTPTTSVSRPQLKSNPQRDRVLRSNSHGKKLKVEKHRRNVNLPKSKMSVTACNDSFNAKTVSVTSVSAMCAKCVMIEKHDLCVPKSVAKPLTKTVASESIKKPRNNLIEIVLFIVDSGCSKHMTGNLKLLINFVEKFLGTVKFGNDQIAPILGYGDLHDMCVPNSVAKPLKRTVTSESKKKPINITRKLYERISKACSWWYPKFTPSGYKWKPKSGKENVNSNLVEIVLFIVDSGCSKHMTGNLKLLINFVEKFMRTVKFGNDQIAPILGYGDLVQGAVTIKKVYYVEGLNHNLFSVGQFCDADLEVAFRKSTCYIRDLKGNDLLTGSRGTNLYSITLQDTHSPNPICLMAKATSSQSWLCHRRLSHLNFDTINLLSKNDIVNWPPNKKFILKNTNVLAPEIYKLHTESNQTRTSQLPQDSRKTNKYVSFSTGVIPTTSVSRPQLKSNPMGDRVMRNKSNQNPRNITRKLYERVSKTCSWWYSKFTPSGYKWKPKSRKDNINPNVSMPLRNASRTANVMDTMTSRKSTCFIRDLKGNDLLVARTSWLSHHRLSHLNFDTINLLSKNDIVVDLPKLKFVKDHLCSSCELGKAKRNLSPVRKCQENVSHGDKIDTTSNELDLLFSPMFDELLNGSSKVVSKSSAVSAADAPNQRQQPTTPLNNHTTPAPTCQTPPITTSVISSKNINQAEPHAENDEVAEDEFINIFSTPVQDQGETSSRHVDSSSMHTFYQCYSSEQRWTKDHPLEQVIGNPSQSVRT